MTIRQNYLHLDSINMIKRPKLKKKENEQQTVRSNSR
jgi:hypothetical protein